MRLQSLNLLCALTAFAAGAGLVLDFAGEIEVKDVRYAGQVVSGTISAATHPEFVSGSGGIYSPARGTILSIY